MKQMLYFSTRKNGLVTRLKYYAEHNIKFKASSRARLDRSRWWWPGMVLIETIKERFKAEVRKKTMELSK